MIDGAGERGAGRRRVVSDGGTAALRRVLAGYAFASVAVGTTGVAVAVALFDRSASTAWATAGAVARVAPFVVLGAIAGLVAGRLPARRTLLVAAVAQVVAATALLATASTAPLAIVACVSVVAHVAWTVAYPSIVSLVPRLVPATSIVTANGWLATLEALAWIVGPGVGGVVIAAAGVEAAAAMAIGCGVIAVVCLAPGAVTRSAAGDESVEHVGLDRNDRSGASGRLGATAVSTGSGVKDTIAVLRDGARLVTGNPSTLGAVTLHLLADLIAGAVAVLLIVVAAERLGFGDGGYGVLSAAAAAGSFGALVLVRRLAGVTRPWSLLAVAVLASGAPIGVLAVVDAPAPALVLVAVSGLGGVMAEVMALTTVQRTVPERSIAQVIGLLDTVSIGAFVIGTLVAGPLVELVGLDVALVGVGAILPAVGVLVAPWLLRGVEPGDRLVLLPGAQLIAGVSVLSLADVHPDPAVAASDSVLVAVEEAGPSGEHVLEPGGSGGPRESIATPASSERPELPERPGRDGQDEPVRAPIVMGVGSVEGADLGSVAASSAPMPSAGQQPSVVLPPSDRSAPPASVDPSARPSAVSVAVAADDISSVVADAGVSAGVADAGTATGGPPVAGDVTSVLPASDDTGGVDPDDITGAPSFPDDRTPDDITGDPVAFAPDEITPDEITPDEITPDDITGDPVEITPDEITPDEITPDPISPDPINPDPITVEADDESGGFDGH